MKYLMNPDLTHIFLALIMDFLFGDPERLYHPVRGIGLFITEAEKLISAKKRSRKYLRICGFLLWVVTVSGSFLMVSGILWLAYRVHPVIFTMMNIVLIWQGIAAGSLKRESTKVMIPLIYEDIHKARKNLSYIVGRDTRVLNKVDIIKATVETVAENTSDGVIAPLFYALIGGAPLLWVYKAVNTLDSMVGYNNDKYRDLGYVSAKMDDLFNYIPARITAIFIMISSLLPGYSFRGSIHVWRRDKRNHKSPNSGHPEAAVAGALGIQLGGNAVYSGKVVLKPSIGTGKRVPEAEDIERTNKLMYSTSILFFLSCSLIIMLILRGGGLNELPWWRYLPVYP